MIILGIDPGSRFAGYGLVKKEGNRFLHIDNGVCCVPNTDDFSKKLVFLHRHFDDIIKTFKPDSISIENIFVHKNVKSAQKLGEARGVLILTAALHDLPVFEYTPLEVKKAITGYGQATKDQMMLMVRRLLNLRDLAEENASDALGLALCHAQSYKVLAMNKVLNQTRVSLL